MTAHMLRFLSLQEQFAINYYGETANARHHGAVRTSVLSMWVTFIRAAASVQSLLTRCGDLQGTGI
jgi:hypothetical protein